MPSRACRADAAVVRQAGDARSNLRVCGRVRFAGDLHVHSRLQLQGTMGKSFPAASLRPASNHRRGHARRRAFVRRAAVLLLDGQRQRKRAASYAMRKARAAILAYNQRRRQVRGVIGCPGVGDPCEVSCRWPIFLPVSPTRPRRPLKSGDCRAVGKWLPRSACRTRAVAPMRRQPRLRRVRSSILARTRRSRRPWNAWSARWTACVWRWCAMPRRPRPPHCRVTCNRVAHRHVAHTPGPPTPPLHTRPHRLAHRSHTSSPTAAALMGPCAAALMGRGCPYGPRLLAVTNAPGGYCAQGGEREAEDAGSHARKVEAEMEAVGAPSRAYDACA